MCKLKELQKQQADYEKALRALTPPDKYTVEYAPASPYPYTYKGCFTYYPETNMVKIQSNNSDSSISISLEEIPLLVKALTDFCGDEP